MDSLRNIAINFIHDQPNTEIFLSIYHQCPRAYDPKYKFTVIMAPIDAAFRRLSAAIGKPVETLYLIPEFVDMFLNHFSILPMQDTYPMITSVNGVQYGSNKADVDKLKIISRTVVEYQLYYNGPMASTIVYIVDSVRYHGNQAQLLRAAPVPGAELTHPDSNVGYEAWLWKRYFAKTSKKILEPILDANSRAMNSIVQAAETNRYIMLLDSDGVVWAEKIPRTYMRESLVNSYNNEKYEPAFDATDIMSPLQGLPKIKKMACNAITAIFLDTNGNAWISIRTVMDKYKSDEKIEPREAVELNIYKLFRRNIIDIASNNTSSGIHVYLLDRSGAIWIYGQNYVASYNTAKRYIIQNDYEYSYGKLNPNEPDTNSYLQSITMKLKSDYIFSSIVVYNDSGLLATDINGFLHVEKTPHYSTPEEDKISLQIISSIPNVIKASSEYYNSDRGVGFVTILDANGILYYLNMNDDALATLNPAEFGVVPVRLRGTIIIDRTGQLFAIDTLGYQIDHFNPPPKQAGAVYYEIPNARLVPLEEYETSQKERTSSMFSSLQQPEEVKWYKNPPTGIFDFTGDIELRRQPPNQNIEPQILPSRRVGQLMPLPQRYVEMNSYRKAQTGSPPQRMKEIQAMTDEDLVAAVRPVNRRPFLTTPTRQDLEERLFDFEGKKPIPNSTPSTFTPSTNTFSNSTLSTDTSSNFTFSNNAISRGI